MSILVPMTDSKKYIIVFKKGGKDKRSSTPSIFDISTSIGLDYLCGMGVIIRFQFPNAMIVGWEKYDNGFEIHLFFLSIEFVSLPDSEDL